MGVLAENGRRAGGRIVFRGQAIDEASTRRLLWRDIAYVPQSAMSSLDPVYTLGSQLVEVMTRRGGFSRSAARARSVELFELVGLSASRLADYPHQFSGGMRQRAAIAMALALRPSLVLADEPVTALDVIVQRQILDMLRSLQRQLELSMVLVTHDISVVAYLCDEVVVMYAGQVIESGPVREVLARPRHPYTMGLRNAFPDLLSDALELVPIEGSPPDLAQPPPGCRFAPRCPFARASCSKRARLHRRQPRARSTSRPACATARSTPSVPSPWTPRHGSARRATRRRKALPGDALARRDGARPAPGRARAGRRELRRRRARRRRRRGRIGLRQDHARSPDAEACRADRGRHRLRRHRPGNSAGEGLRGFRRQAQLVFQNPFEALNPRFTIYRAVAEPLLSAGIDRAEHMDRVVSAFRRVHLPDVGRYLDKYPHQLSGGQLQRVVLARALVLGPRFLVADEPVSMLDVSVRAGILALMREVRDSHGAERRLHPPRSRAGALPLRAHACDVSRPRRRGRADRADRAPAAPSLHARPGRRRAGARRRPVARPAADQGQRAGRARAAVGLQLPRSLPPRDGPLRRRRRRSCAPSPKAIAWPAISILPSLDHLEPRSARPRPMPLP